MLLQAREVGQASQRTGKVGVTCAKSVHVITGLYTSHKKRALLELAQTIGNGEVDSSILSGSTSFSKQNHHLAIRPPRT